MNILEDFNVQESQITLASQNGGFTKSVRSQTKSQRQFLKTSQASILPSGNKLFETPSYTHVDRFIDGMIKSPEM